MGRRKRLLDGLRPIGYRQAFNDDGARLQRDDGLGIDDGT